MRNYNTLSVPIPAGTGLRMLSVLLGAILLVGSSLHAMEAEMTDNGSKTTRHIVLLGASIGEKWDLSGVPERTGTRGFVFEYVGNYSPDKSELLAGILSREEGRPDAVIIKQCSAYFPGNEKKLKPMIKDWVADCHEAGVVPALATVVPVVWSFPLRIFIYNLVKGKWGWPKGTIEAVTAFNDWIREYAAQEGLVVVDLEAAVRTSDTDRHLNGRYATRDGMHLNAKAYRQLDSKIVQAVSKIEFAD